MTKNSIDSTIPIEITKGGTASSSMNSDGVSKYDGTSVVTSTACKIDSSNIMTNSSQTCYAYYLSSTQNNKIGTVPTNYIIGTNALTAIFDPGSNFSGTTFTAPVTGTYLFNGHLYITGCTIANYSPLFLITSNRNYHIISGRAASSSDWYFVMDNLCDMDAGDTAYFQANAQGEAADTDDIGGGADFLTGVSGCLVC